MASVTKVELIDDMDGTTAHETVPFAIDGTEYEIDLSDNHAGILRDILSDYIERGRKVRKALAATAGRRPASGTRPDADQTRAIREWARREGHQVSDRGRISAEIREKFTAAHV